MTPESSWRGRSDDPAMSRRYTRNLAQIAATLRELVTLSYPGFVYGESRLGATPAFCFHGVELEPFRAMLAFLDANGYRTLDADEYQEVVTGRKSPGGRAVVLTFDDGWRSLWTVGLPLLREYGAKAVVFLVPGRMTADSESLLLDWGCVREMHASGLVDFQSHSLTHGLVSRSTRIADFVRPGIATQANYLDLPHPMRYGEPMRESAPRLSDVPRMLTDDRIGDACAEFVASHGGARFFEDPSWRTRLREIAASEAAKSALQPRRETPGEQTAAIGREMAESKRVIEEMLPGKAVRHFCYPWHAAGKIASAEALTAGYVTSYLGKVDGRYFNPAPCDPQRIARLGGDFFFRLPGKGRVSLLGILLTKAIRRAREGYPYLTH